MDKNGKSLHITMKQDESNQIYFGNENKLEETI